MAACIISTAQQARPKVNGHSEPALAQEITEINLVEIHSSFILNIRVIYINYLDTRKERFTNLVKPSGRPVPYIDRRFRLKITGEKS
jgi:hypothetical protein